MFNRICDHEGCRKPAEPAGFVYGHAYCEDHYFLGLQSAFSEELSSLRREKPSNKFRNLFGRYAEAIYKVKGIVIPEELAGNKLRDRAERIQHQDDTITFTLVRHPTPVPVQQWWCFDLDKQEFTMINEKSAYLDCKEVAIVLRMAPETVRKYIKQGKIRAQRVSETKEINDWFDDKLRRGNYDVYTRRNLITRLNKWLIPREELCRFMTEN